MPDSTNRLKARWIGPGVITKKLSDYSYSVALDNGSVKVLHANKLRLFESRVQMIGIVNDSDVDFGDIITYPSLADCCDVNFESQLKNLDLTHLNDNQKLLLFNVLKKRRACFSDKPGRCDPKIAEHSITVVEGFRPKRMYPYRIPEKLKLIVDEQIDELLRDGRIRESPSEYAHPIVCVTKPDRSIRICTDLRHINSGTVSCQYPLHRVDDLLREVSPADFITTLDCV